MADFQRLVLSPGSALKQQTQSPFEDTKTQKIRGPLKGRVPDSDQAGNEDSFPLRQKASCFFGVMPEIHAIAVACFLAAGTCPHLPSLGSLPHFPIMKPGHHSPPGQDGIRCLQAQRLLLRRFHLAGFSFAHGSSRSSWRSVDPKVPHVVTLSRASSSGMITCGYCVFVVGC